MSGEKRGKAGTDLSEGRWQMPAEYYCVYTPEVANIHVEYPYQVVHSVRHEAPPPPTLSGTLTILT